MSGLMMARALQRARGVLVAVFIMMSAVQTTIFIMLPLALLHPAFPKRVLAVLRGITMAGIASGAIMLEKFGVTVSVDIRGATEKQLLSDIKGNLIVLMNMHSRLDWLFAWMIELRFGWGASKVVVAKDVLRHVPGVGWAMQLLRYIFVYGSWSTDEERMSYVVRSLQRDGPSAVLLFPEGADLSKSHLATSHQFAKDRDLPLFDNVLIPRTRGFVHLFNLMKAAAEPLAVWDITVGYVGLPGGSGESEFLSGAWPVRVHYRISRWPAEQIPADNRALALWLKERWAEKEHLLDDYSDCEGAHMMLPAESSQPSSPVDSADPRGMLLPAVTTSPFPWQAWKRSGAPTFIVANLVVFPVLLVCFAWARWWLLIGIVICAVMGKLGGFDTLITGAPARAKEPRSLKS